MMFISATRPTGGGTTCASTDHPFSLVNVTCGGGDPGEPRGGEASAFGWMGGMLATALLLGFAVGGPLFAFVYIRFHGRRPWPVALAVAAGLGLAVVVVFDWAFGAPLWRGQLWVWLGI